MVAEAALADRVPVRKHQGYCPGLVGVPYARLIEIARELQEFDPAFTYDTLRPLGDEVWNLIDGSRTAAEITRAVNVEFGLAVPPAYVVELLEGLVAEGFAAWAGEERS